MRSRVLHAALAAILLISAAPAEAPLSSDVRALSAAIDNHYNHLHTLTADFTETYSGAGAQRSESGVLFLKKPGKMRWEYRSPREKLFVSDGKMAWFFVQGEQQARQMPAGKLDDLRSPLAFLLGKTRLEKELKGLSIASDVLPARPGDVVLRGVPVGEGQLLSLVEIEVAADGRIVRIILHSTDESVTEYRFDNQKEDSAMADREFRFSPPPGVEVLDENFAQ